MRHILSIDAETNGLHGQVFAIGAMLVSCNDDYTQNKMISYFFDVSHIDIHFAEDEWVLQNVIPKLKKKIGKPMSEWGEPIELIKSFGKFYYECCELSPKPEVVVFCGYLVETNLFGVLKEHRFIGEYDHPLPLIDIATIFKYEGYKDPVSMEKNYEAITGCRFESKHAHDPIYDAQTQLDVYLKLMQNKHK